MPRISRAVSWLSLRCLLVVGVLSFVTVGLRAVPFTYQGRLAQGGSLPSGSFELRFRLFDQAASGVQVGATLEIPAVAVTNGLFSVSLDFGPGVFNGSDRWLELGARPAGSPSPLVVFEPRQRVHAVPYALHAFSGPSDASLLTQGILPDARLAETIARTSQLITLSNAQSARIDQLAAQVNALAGALAALSNGISPTVPAGFNLVSSHPADPALLSQGYVRFFTVPASGWINGTAAAAPSARLAHTAVWSGNRLLVWGGALSGGTLVNSGAAYDPSTDSWQAISLIEVPTARRGHTAVWTGDAMVVWGGFAGTQLATGGAYSVASGAWSPVPTVGAPAERDGHVAVWTGFRMVVWGGRNAGGLLADGGVLDPAIPSWSALPVSGAPEARMGATAVWTGSRLVVWGGLGELAELGTGGSISLAGGITPGAWSSTSVSGAPAPRLGHTAVWTGQRMLVWGGSSGGVLLADGASYDPATDTWTPLPSGGAPTARAGHVAEWTGEEMLVWGGETVSGSAATGAAYNPATGLWRPLSTSGGPVARAGAVSGWTGTEVLVFGGQGSGVPQAALQRLNPQPDWYFYRKP